MANDHDRNNSRSSDSGTPRPNEHLEVADVGIDTVSFSWRPSDPDLWKHIERAARAGELTDGAPTTMPIHDDGVVRRTRLTAVSRQGRKAGAVVRATERIAGVVWEIDLEHRVIYCEGRLACLLEDDPAAVGLRPAVALPLAAWCASMCMFQLGVELHADDTRIRRIDIAGDLRFANPELGCDFLSVLALGGGSPDVRSFGSVVRSISWLRANRVQFRAYDRGALADTHPAGALIRLERQLSFRKDSQPPIAEMLKRDLAKEWQSELERHTREVPPPGTCEDAGRVVLDQMASGELPHESGTRLLGNIARLELGGYAAWPATKFGQQARARVVRALASCGVATVVAKRRRNEPWQTRAHCRPVGRVVTVDDAMALVCAGLQAIAATAPTARRRGR